MGKKKSSSPPAAPAPQSEYYYQNGVLQSSRVYDKAKKAYTDNTYLNPNEQAIFDTAETNINNLLGQAGQAFDFTPEQLDQYAENYAAPQRRALQDAYDQSTGSVINRANSSGLLNSSGRAYQQSLLDKNRAQGLSDIAANAELQKYNLPRLALAPFADALNLYSGALGNQNAQSNQEIQLPFQGSQAANQFNLANYQNQFNAWANRPKSFMERLFG